MKEQSKETRVKSTDPNEEYIATSIWLKKLFDPCPFLFLFFDSTDASFFFIVSHSVERYKYTDHL
jgi:hypothetical protein